MLKYFSKKDIALWVSSMLIILVSFLAFDRSSCLTLIASLIGVTSLIFLAKGNPVGNVLMIIFSTIYGYISFSFAYYGEVATYVGMTLPMAVFSLVSWLRNPFKGKKSEVEVNSISKKEVVFMLFLTAAVSILFYFVLEFFGTANLLPSTISVSTSFAAAYLTFRRSPYYALVYALNDLVLIALWIMATFEDISYLSVIICFAVFFVNDIYGFINWQKMKKRQNYCQ